MPRIHCDSPLSTGLALGLPPGAARHVQVLRLQPGDTVTLFDGRGGEFDAAVTRMGRSEVEVLVGAQHPVEREAARAVHLALGMPANERMDWLVEKASELGVASIQPLHAERSVLRLKGERADKKREHWQGVAVAACEQSGRNRVPPVQAVQDILPWLRALPAAGPARLLLSLAPGTRPLRDVVQLLPPDPPVLFLSGPEGGLSPAEDAAARAAGFTPVTLGPRILRSETAPLAALASLTL